MKKVAIIPVRSGSKRFHGKNFSKFSGSTLIENTIAKLRKAKINKIIISTDVPEKVLLTVKEDKNTCIYKRPTELAQDDSKIEDVIFDVVNRLKYQQEEDYIIVLAQVTSPNWLPHSLIYAISKLEDKGLDSVVSVSPDYKPNGCFYIFKMSTFLKSKKIYSSNMYLVDLNWTDSIDIDFEYQLYIAEAIERGNIDV